MKTIKIDITTLADGSFTGLGADKDVMGWVDAVQLIDGTLDDGVDVTVTFEEGDLSIPVLVKADFNTDQIKYPRVLESLNTDGSDLTTHTRPLAMGQAKVVIAQGGNVKLGAVVIYVMEDLHQ